MLCLCIEIIERLQGVTHLSDAPNLCAQVHQSPCTFTGDRHVHLSSADMIWIILYKCLSLAAFCRWILQ